MIVDHLPSWHWGVNARDWADIQQHTIRPAAQAALAGSGPWGGRSLLDIGCGSGVVAQLACEMGATVTGLDACAPLIDIARQRVPGAVFRMGDMHELPFPDAAFSAAIAFNSLQHAADPARALHETARVLQPGGVLIVGYWELTPDSDALAYLLDLGGLMPPDPAPPALWTRHTTPTLLEAAGLTPGFPNTVACPWHYPDLNTALRGLLSTGPAVQAINYSGRASVLQALGRTLASHRQPDGSYQLDTVCSYFIAANRSPK